MIKDVFVTACAPPTSLTHTGSLWLSLSSFLGLTLLLPDESKLLKLGQSMAIYKNCNTALASKKITPPPILFTIPQYVEIQSYEEFCKYVPMHP